MSQSMNTTTSPAVELLPCPFCGGERVKAHYIRDGESLGCQDCGASVRSYQPNAGDKNIGLWNTRPAKGTPGIDVERVALIKGALAANLDLSTDLLIELEASGNLDAVVQALEAIGTTGIDAELIARLTSYADSLDALRQGVTLEQSERLASVTPALAAKAMREAALAIGTKSEPASVSPANNDVKGSVEIAEKVFGLIDQHREYPYRSIEWVADELAALGVGTTKSEPASGDAGPFMSQAHAWNDALEKAAQIVERYNAAFDDPECGGAPGDIRALKRSATNTEPTVTDATKRMAKTIGCEFVPHNRWQQAGSEPTVGVSDLKARLLAVESSGDELGGDICTNSYRNPDGPEALVRIEQLEAGMRRAVSKFDELSRLIATNPGLAQLADIVAETADAFRALLSAERSGE